MKRQPASSLSSPVPTPREWGHAQAALAPAWSEETWVSALATLGVISLQHREGRDTIEA